jgi:hypothetical protein
MPKMVFIVPRIAVHACLVRPVNARKRLEAASDNEGDQTLCAEDRSVPELGTQSLVGSRLPKTLNHCVQ